MKLVTLLIPAYNEEEVLGKLYNKVTDVIDPLINQNLDFEILFVNDGSNDGTLDIIKQLRENDNRISYINLSRNFGKETAMIAGFDYANGEALIIMDADLQHPPNVIPEMLYYWEKGYDDIYAKRMQRKGENWIKKFTSKQFYKILQKVSDIPVLPDAGDFRLLDRRCVEALKKLRETHRYTKGLYSWIGFNKKEIEYDAAAREAGITKWNLKSLMGLAMEGITSFTTFPLRLSTIFGFSISALSFLYLIYIIIKTIVSGPDVNGYPSLMVVILFLGGIQLISLGIIGEYLGRIFTETKNRPLYLVDEYNKDSSKNNSLEKVR